MQRKVPAGGKSFEKRGLRLGCHIATVTVHVEALPKIITCRIYKQTGTGLGHVETGWRPRHSATAKPTTGGTEDALSPRAGRPRARGRDHVPPNRSRDPRRTVSSSPYTRLHPRPCACSPPMPTRSWGRQAHCLTCRTPPICRDRSLRPHLATDRSCAEGPRATAAPSVLCGRDHQAPSPTSLQRVNTLSQ